jgi:hypothetical protein
VADDAGPVQDYGHTLTWDEDRGDVFIYGGLQGRYLAASSSAWNGAVWTELVLVGDAPPVRARHAMAYDPVQKTMVLFGGGGSPSQPYSDTWVLSR